jgi:hypothetical protein
MAMHVAARPDLIDIYLGGVKVAELLREEEERKREDEKRTAEEEMLGAMIEKHEREGMKVPARKVGVMPQPQFKMHVPPRSIFDDVDL